MVVLLAYEPADDEPCELVAQTELGACDRDRRELQRLVMEGDVGKPNDLFGIVLLALGRFDQFAAEEIVDGRHAAGLR